MELFPVLNENYGTRYQEVFPFLRAHPQTPLRAFILSTGSVDLWSRKESVFPFPDLNSHHVYALPSVFLAHSSRGVEDSIKDIMERDLEVWVVIDRGA